MSDMERRAILVRGIVQGVGFRPFVYNLAVRLRLQGFVQNLAGSVHIEVEGEPSCLDQFVAELRDHPPPLARLSDFSWERRPTQGEDHFRIDPSASDASNAIFFSPDVATCAECLAELFDPRDRRFGYPFLNCTNCGPRLTIITGAPYDRSRTTMASFTLCPACQAEYDDPANRRFHAQPIACPACGPRLELRRAGGQPVAAADLVLQFAAGLRDGQIGALKGLGGYHLACDASNAVAVAELRKRKQRDEKPFAIMVGDVVSAAVLCEVSASEAALLTSPQCPIVLLRKRPTNRVADEVAPKNPFLGVMLPSTPLHHLLVREMVGIPLVMTSGNRSDEPIAYEDEDALERLADIADLFLAHNRPIHVRCDDSVTRVVDGRELPLRRSRGYAPQPVRLPLPCPRPTLAVGGQLKSTFALGREHDAFLSHHLGDLDHYSASCAFQRDVALYEQLFDIQPELVVHDLHPDYASTRFAHHYAQSGIHHLPLGARALQLLAVQHHHAHIASCLAEHGMTEQVIGVAFDGTGYGTDGAIWGGEFLVANAQNFRRAAHLRYVGLPGGDGAVREPWRMAVAHLEDAQVSNGPRWARVSLPQLRTVQKVLERRLNTPWTSSAGRLFDAVAALAGVRERVSYEGQAALELEWLAAQVPPTGTYPFDLVPRHDGTSSEIIWVIDTRPLIRAVAHDATSGIEAPVIARRFHSSLVELIAVVCSRLRDDTCLTTVALSGGVFLNVLLTTEVCDRLSRDGFRVLRHRLVPPSDGGLSLGQLAVAAAQSSG
jgi:hydrogenase maturation protein HypF